MRLDIVGIIKKSTRNEELFIYIKELNLIEIDTALQLIWEVFLEFEAPDYSEEGVKTFENFLKNELIIYELDFYGAFIDNELVGVIAMRNQTHITMLFTKKEFHRKGIAKALFNNILEITENSEKKVFTVNSSPYAVEFYHKLGFKNIDEQSTIDGIIFTPMKFSKV